MFYPGNLDPLPSPKKSVRGYLMIAFKSRPPQWYFHSTSPISRPQETFNLLSCMHKPCVDYPCSIIQVLHAMLTKGSSKNSKENSLVSSNTEAIKMPENAKNTKPECCSIMIWRIKN